MKHDWKYKKLGEVCEIVGGSTPKTNISSFWNGKYPWVTPAELDGSKYIDRTERYLTDEALAHNKLQLLPIGTVLLSSRAPIGKLAITTIPMYCNQGFKNVVVGNKLNNEFVYWYLTFKKDYIISLGRGATFKEISKSITEKIPVPVPPLPIQQQIVEELDKLSEIIEKKKQQVKELDTLAQSIFYDMFGEILEATPTKSLKDVAEYFIGLTYKPSDVSGNGHIVLRSSNIQNNILDFNDTVRVNVKINEKKFVQEGDILMCARNGSAKLVGKVARISNLQEQMSFGAFMTIIRSQYNDYLFHFFLSHFFRGQLTTSKTATINQITTKMLDGIKLNIPTIEQQQSFAQKIEAIEKQKELINQSIKEAQTLFDARMDYYFGE